MATEFSSYKSELDLSELGSLGFAGNFGNCEMNELIGINEKN